MTATTSTSIQGVSVLSDDKEKRRDPDTFELGLSQSGIEVRRPGRPVQQMSWDRVSEWEIEERRGYVLLTLRGRGATTPLVVPGWSLDDLEILMRDVTSDSPTYEPNGPGPVVADGAAVAPAATVKAPKPHRHRTAAPPPAATVTAPAATRAPTPPKASPPAKKAPAPSRAERRQQASKARRQRRPLQVSWKLVAAVVLLGALATAVTLVLLQSAGVIDWSFLGPVA